MSIYIAYMKPLKIYNERSILLEGIAHQSLRCIIRNPLNTPLITPLITALSIALDKSIRCIIKTVLGLD